MLEYAGNAWYGYDGIWWDMLGYGRICEGGVFMWRESLAHALQRFLFCPPWFLHLLRKLFKLKRASRSIAKTGFLGSSKSMAGAVF